LFIAFLSLEQIISVRNLGNVQQVVQFLELGMFAALGLLYLIIFIFIYFYFFAEEANRRYVQWRTEHYKLCRDELSHMIPQIIDPELLYEKQNLSQETSLARKEKSLECLLSVLSIGLLCTKPSPNERICMQEVAARLHSIKKAYTSEN
jgi:hypothetical protein